MLSTRVFSQNIHEPARMVERYLPESSFDVVYQVYRNLDNIQTITNNLRTFSSVANSTQDIARINQYLTEIQKLANKLDSLVRLSDNADYLKSIEPNLTKLVEDIKEIKTDYKAFIDKVYSLEEGIRKVSLQAKEDFSKHVQERETDLRHLANKVHNDLEEISDSILESYNMKKELETYRCYILHTNAYVAVQDYKTSPSSTTKDRALKTIAMSEAIGNDESVNRLRMQEV